MESSYQLPAIFDSTSVSQVREALRGLEGSVHLDGSKVEVVDTAGAQLLAAFAMRGSPVRLRPSPALAELLAITAVGLVLTLES